jgi:hypothetical protein
MGFAGLKQSLLFSGPALGRAGLLQGLVVQFLGVVNNLNDL